MWAISFQVLSKKAKVGAQQFFFFFFSWSLSEQKVEDRAAEGVSAKNCVWMQAWKPAQAVSKVFKIFKKQEKKNPYVEKSVFFFFFFKCHISRDYRPVLWAGSSSVFIIKWPSNRSSSSGSSPSSGWRSRLCASVPSRELPQSLWCIFQRACDTTAKKSRVPHSSLSSITSSELLQNLLNPVDNPLRFLQPGWLNAACLCKPSSSLFFF